MPAPTRSFLFLQGPLSPLYARIALRLRSAGHDVHRVNLCIGDVLHWRIGGATDFRGRPEAWPSFVRDVMVRRGVSDLVLHGDMRLYHRLAIEQAKALGVRVVVTELGLLRPDWMTIERGGTGTRSLFPRDPVAIRALAARAQVPDLEPRYRASFLKVAVPDVIYNLANTALWPLYPHYQRHTIYFPPLEYAVWVGRLVGGGRRERAAQALVQRLVASEGELFVFPLQLEGDFQIRANPAFAGQGAAIRHVLASFRDHAGESARIVFKTHPLDNGLERWGESIASMAAEVGVRDRVLVMDGGTLAPLLARARGVVTINSSAGIEALRAGRPVKTLAPAVYDVAGLTHQDSLDTFWRSPAMPDANLLADFITALTATIQVRGTIYSEDGLAAAVDGMTAKILGFADPQNSVP